MSLKKHAHIHEDHQLTPILIKNYNYNCGHQILSSSDESYFQFLEIDISKIKLFYDI